MSEENFIQERMDELKSIIDEIGDINNSLVAGYDYSNPEEINSLIQKHTARLARTDILCANAERLLAEARGFYAERIDSKMQATRFREVLEAKVSIFQRAYTQAAKTNATLKEAINALRSQLSYLKEEMRNSYNQRG